MASHPCTDPHHHVEDADAYVQEVERACRARGLRLTPIRAQALRLIAGRTRIPIITKPAVARELPREHLAVFELGAAARDLYVLAASAREERRGGSDWRTGPAVV